jgi:beta-barrel assembly-enhancing protease
LREHKFASEPAARYGLARAQLRAKNYPAAEREIVALRQLNASSPMVDALAAEVRLAQGDAPGALKTFRDAKQRYPQDKALAYGLIETLLGLRRPEEALHSVSDELRLYPGDARLWELQAKSYAALGKHLQQHRSQAEVYALQGQLSAAVEQLQLAQKAGDGDFYEQSAVDARLREMRQRQTEEAKRK